MAEFEATVGVDASAERIDIELPLLDVKGVQRFLLSCHGGSNEYVDTLSKIKKVNYVPPFLCLLNEGKQESEQSLLTEDDAAPWHSRGQYHWEDLLGDCGGYPEYGRVRHFRLRGFNLTFEAVDLVTKGTDLGYFKLKVSVRNDSTAVTKIAARPGYLPPDKSCKVVRKGDAPRMCRNWANGGSYEQCSH